MPNMRTFLLIALLVTGFFLWEAWQRDFHQTPAPATTRDSTQASQPATVEPTSDVPAVQLPSAVAPAAPATDLPAAPAPAAAAAQTADPGTAKRATRAQITISTDLLMLTIDLQGGTVVDAQLLDYPIAPQDRSKVVHLLEDSSENFFVAQSGFVSAIGTAPTHHSDYVVEGSEFALANGSDSIQVPMSWESNDGLRVTKIFKLTRGSYVIEVSHRIDNSGSSTWSASEYRQLQRNSPLLNRKFSFTNPEQYSFVGASWYSPEKHYEKLQFEHFADEPLDRAITGGWIAQQQHYFLAAWIPPATETARATTAVVDGSGAQRYLVRAMAPAISVAPGANTTTSSRLYIGPKLQDHLEEVATGLEYTVDYGMVTILSEPLFWALKWLHTLTGNWGLAIIFITILIKLAFFKLTEAQYRSFAKMRKLTPRLAALKERYGDDKAKMNQAMMELYQKEKINPLGGCLPILVQIPVFIALYWVLLESVELRQAPFFGWIQNLSDKDPYFILPLLNGLAMFAAQKLTPTAGMDPLQARMMQMMPIVFSIMFAFFPAGLVLYWTVNGALGLAQQW